MKKRGCWEFVLVQTGARGLIQSDDNPTALDQRGNSLTEENTNAALSLVYSSVWDLRNRRKLLMMVTGAKQITMEPEPINVEQQFLNREQKEGVFCVCPETQQCFG